MIHIYYKYIVIPKSPIFLNEIIFNERKDNEEKKLKKKVKVFFFIEYMC